MLFQKETHLCGGGRILQQKNVFDDLIQVEELNRFQGPPYLFPTARQIRPVQHVDEGSFKVGHPEFHTGTLVAGDTEHLFALLPKEMRYGNAREFMRLKLQLKRFTRGYILQPRVDRVCLSVEFQSRVVCKDRVLAHFRRYEIRIDRTRCRIAAQRNGRI